MNYKLAASAILCLFGLCMLVLSTSLVFVCSYELSCTIFPIWAGIICIISSITIIITSATICITYRDDNLEYLPLL
jgi:hypothetical protein